MQKISSIVKLPSSWEKELKKTSLDLNIYSPDKQKIVEFQNLKEISYVEHADIYLKMKQMDVFLLPISKVGNRDYSNYTSPLKLFEYASCGRVILYTPVDSLIDLNFPDGFYPCENSSDWLSTLEEIFKNTKHNDHNIQRGIYRWSKKYTWDNRVKNIIEYANS